MSKLKKAEKPKKKGKAYLFGPFVGEVDWEFYRFAPHSIYLKKQDPTIKIIVLTRKERFDLYGKYASILVPLNIKNENEYKSSAFGLIDYKTEYYYTIKKFFYEKYDKEYEIVDHFYPRINSWRRKIKWQLPRSQMDYDFLPRNDNIDIVNTLIGDYPEMTYVETKYSDELPKGYVNITSDDFVTKVVGKVDNIRSTYLGCIIVLLRRVKFVIGNLDSPIAHLALLLGIPLISVNEKRPDDSINLLNPLETMVIRCSTVEEGVKIYEDNFRSPKSWSWKQRGLGYSNKIREYFSGDEP